MYSQLKQEYLKEYRYNNLRTAQDKVLYIRETLATMMDVQPITCVGQENPAKKRGKKKCKDDQD